MSEKVELPRGGKKPKDPLDHHGGVVRPLGDDVTTQIHRYHRYDRYVDLDDQGGAPTIRSKEA